MCRFDGAAAMVRLERTCDDFLADEGHEERMQLPDGSRALTGFECRVTAPTALQEEPM
jgi:hypothetical protein